MQVGEEVLAWDEASDTTGRYRVVATWAYDDPATTYLTIAGERIVATPAHPFYTQERGWVPAGLLRVGERVRKATGGWGTVRAVRSAWDVGVRYNLTVDGAQTYAVGDGDWVVHNSLCGPIWTPDRRNGRSPVENAYSHYKKHGSDFPAVENAKQYVEEAHSFLNNPPSTAVTRTRPNGDTVVYDPVSDAFGVRTSGGAPRTYYVPDPAQHGYPTNLDYFWNSR